MWIGLMILKGDMTSIPRGQLGRDTSSLWILLWVGKICVRKFNYSISIPTFQGDDRVTGTIGAFSQELDSLTVSKLTDFPLFVSVLRFI